MRDKILSFDGGKARLARESRDRYTPDSLAELHYSIFEELVDPAYRNNVQPQKIASLVRSLRPGPERGMRARAGAFLQLTVSDPRRALTVLNLDSVPGPEVLAEIAKDPDISDVKVVKL